jgi:hypothetical protein
MDLPVADYGAGQEVHLAVYPIGEVEDVGGGVAAAAGAGPKPDRP